ncbi:MAG: hypothetical protein ACP5UH_00555 [Candidatus Micrarchaeia archaeon]
MDGNESVAVISECAGIRKLAYVSNGKKVYVTWEQKPEAVLETMFNEEGAILQQKYEQIASEDIEREISGIIKMNMITKVRHEQYEDITFSKPCPKCGAKALKRYTDVYKESPVPVMPLYVCSACGSKSYYLTDEYMERLVMDHRELFTEAELLELDKSKGAFLKELKEYIIRIFASKRILCIKG